MDINMEEESEADTAANMDLLDLPDLPRRDRSHSDVASGVENAVVRPLFTEMMEFKESRQKWVETARWVKFEETVEDSHRWSKPHVATTGLISLLQLSACIMDSTVMLDVDVEDFDQFVVDFVQYLEDRGTITSTEAYKCWEMLLKPKQHQHTSHKGACMSHFSYGSGWKKFSFRDLPSMPESTASISSAGGGRDATESNNRKAVAIACNARFYKKLPPACEATNILVGEADFLKTHLFAFVRLRNAVLMPDVTEVPAPTRFIFILLGPVGYSNYFREIGRAIATLMSDSVFAKVPFGCRDKTELIIGMDDFLDMATVLPPSRWNPEVHIRPQAAPSANDAASQAASAGNLQVAQALLAPTDAEQTAADHVPHQEGHAGDPALKRTGRLFGGMFLDLRRKLPWFVSDLTDGLSLQCVSSFCYMYFAILAPLVTFGGLLEEETGRNMASMENVLAAAVVGITWHLFAGQPLVIMSATGPMLVCESIIFEVSNDLGIDYLAFRFWIMFWAAVILLLMTAVDGSSIIRYFTRFTEETFAVLVGVMFIIETIEKLYRIYDNYEAYSTYSKTEVNVSCVCNSTAALLSDNEFKTIAKQRLWKTTWLHSQSWYYQNETTFFIDYDDVPLDICHALKGDLSGSCHESHNIFFMSMFLTMGTFALAVIFTWLRRTFYLPNWLRKLIADFGITWAVFVMVALDWWCGIPTPKLNLPSEIKPTNPDRALWLVNPLLAPWWAIPAGIVPGALVAVLIFVDQQTSTVIINRPENKLAKGYGYHLDLFVVSLQVFLVALLGWPVFVAATVGSIAHVQSLKILAPVKIPGETPSVIGCREQRVTGIATHVLIGLSVFLSPVLQLIPMPVLYGVFLYMGVSALNDIQLVDRFLLLFISSDNQPDYAYLRHVRTSRVHLFTLIQVLLLVALCYFTSQEVTAPAFPVLLIVVVVTRSLLGWVFSKAELQQLDDELPEIFVRREQDRKRKEIMQRKMSVSNAASNYIPIATNTELPAGTSPTIPISNAASRNAELVKRFQVGKMAVSGGGKEQRRSYSRLPRSAQLVNSIKPIAEEPAEDPLHLDSDEKPLFSEMLEFADGEWQESARWIKFEEVVEEGNMRVWSKPHISTPGLISLLQLNTCLSDGNVMLSMQADSYRSIVDQMLAQLKLEGQLGAKEAAACHDILVAPKYHRCDKASGGGLMKRLYGKTEHKNVLGSCTHEEHIERNQRLYKRLPRGCEGFSILICETDALDVHLAVFIRLQQALNVFELTEVPAPIRFVFVLLGPIGYAVRYREVGRAFATLMSDDVFVNVPYSCRSKAQLIAGLDVFLRSTTVLPPSSWHPRMRIKPQFFGPVKRRQQQKQTAASTAVSNLYSVPHQIGAHVEDKALKRTGRFFGGLMDDIDRKRPWFKSDFTDALNMKCLASFLFMYFAVLTPVVTFGGLLEESTGRNLAAIENILAAFVCGVTWHLFSGQPLVVLGCTAPMLACESVIYDTCMHFDIDYLAFRFWVCFWTALILLVMVAVDGSVVVRYFTRFTEESFATLIAIIFIVQSIEKLLDDYDNYTEYTNYSRTSINTTCHCQPPADDVDMSWFDDAVDENIWEEEWLYSQPWYRPAGHNSSMEDIVYELVPLDQCLFLRGSLVGDGCHATHNVFFMSLTLTVLTYVLATTFKEFRHTLYFPDWVRMTISEFAITWTILLMSVLDYACQIPTQKLHVPNDLRPTDPDRTYWLVNPFLNPWHWNLIAICPAFFTGFVLGKIITILIFMDQQTTTIIINRQENNLKKGYGYHLDLFVISIQVFVVGLFGWPVFVAATIRSMTHLNSLKIESDVRIPGEPPEFLGCHEQRLTGVATFAAIGLSIVLTPVFDFIPMSVLYGVFLYMGISSLEGIQLVDRLRLMFIPAKYQPDFAYLRHVRIWRVHLFTILQVAMLIILWIVKETDIVAMAFPLLLLLMLLVRGGFQFIFTKQELEQLDDELPEIFVRTKEDKLRKHGNLRAGLEMALRPTVFISGLQGIQTTGDNKVEISKTPATKSMGDVNQLLGTPSMVARNLNRQTRPSISSSISEQEEEERLLDNDKEAKFHLT